MSGMELCTKKHYPEITYIIQVLFSLHAIWIAVLIQAYLKHKKLKINAMKGLTDNFDLVSGSPISSTL